MVWTASAFPTDGSTARVTSCFRLRSSSALGIAPIGRRLKVQASNVVGVVPSLAPSLLPREWAQ